jgi:hypothetical protein
LCFVRWMTSRIDCTPCPQPPQMTRVIQSCLCHSPSAIDPHSHWASSRPASNPPNTSLGPCGNRVFDAPEALFLRMSHFSLDRGGLARDDCLMRRWLRRSSRRLHDTVVCEFIRSAFRSRGFGEHADLGRPSVMFQY